MQESLSNLAYIPLDFGLGEIPNHTSKRPLNLSFFAPSTPSVQLRFSAPSINSASFTEEYDIRGDLNAALKENGFNPVAGGNLAIPIKYGLGKTDGYGLSVVIGGNTTHQFNLNYAKTPLTVTLDTPSALKNNGVNETHLNRFNLNWSTVNDYNNQFLSQNGALTAMAIGYLAKREYPLGSSGQSWNIKFGGEATARYAELTGRFYDGVAGANFSFAPVLGLGIENSTLLPNGGLLERKTEGICSTIVAEFALGALSPSKTPNECKAAISWNLHF